MKTIIDKYRKQILAVFGIFLMILFVLPPSTKNGAGERSNPVVGHVGSQQVHAQDLTAGQSDWDIITKRVLVHTNNSDPQRQWLPLGIAILSADAATLIDGHRDAYYLLQKEAQNQGLIVTKQEVDELLDQPMIAIVERGRPIAFSDMEDLDEADRIRGAVGRLLMVKNSFNQAADAIKVSEPLRRQFVTQQFQTATLNVMDIPASQFPATQPTQAQVEEQFKKYADVSPDDLERSPLGYGYRYPDRVKLQALELSFADVRSAAEKLRTKDAASQYQWDRDAYKYYSENLSEFPTSSSATTQSTTRTASTATTRPFQQAKEDARQRVLAADIARLEQRIQDRIAGQVNGDYVGYKNAINTGSKVPPSSVGAPYNTYEYFQKIAQDVQRMYGVLPVTSSFEKEFLSASQVATLPAIGQTAVETQPFPVYIFSHTASFLPASQKDDSRALAVYQTGPTIRDDAGNLFVFRVTDAEPSHAPASVQEVLPAVTADVTTASSFAQARDAAMKILTQAKQAGSLQAAAQSTGRNITSVGPIRFTDPQALLPLKLSQFGVRAFDRQAFDLMARVTKSDPHPTALIDIPRDGRVFLAEVASTQSDIPAEQFPMLEAQVAMQARRELMQPLMAEWFNFDAIVARLDYKPVESSKKL